MYRPERGLGAGLEEIAEAAELVKNAAERRFAEELR
jgi:hypothetical protein